MTGCYLTVAEIAARLRVSRATVLALRARGAFPNAVKLGASNRSGWRIPAADLDAYLATLNDTTTKDQA